MTEHKKQKPAGPDLTRGVPLSRLRDRRQLVGHVGDEEVLLVQSDDEIFAVGARCTHYRGPLVDGLVVGDTVRCPWHHTCFSLRTGEPVRPPAFDAIACWRVERHASRVVVKEKLGNPPRPASRRPSPERPASVVIVGGGAAGFACAEMLRREGYDGPVTMISADEDAPYDRPNLSKDYLAGTAQDDWMPLRDEQYYADNDIRLRLKTRVASLDPARRQVTLDDGTSVTYGALLLATGATPRTLDVPGAAQPHVRYLRSFADSRAIIAAMSSAKRVVVVGASFIGLEVAASLRARQIETHVVAPVTRPMEKTMGPAVADLIRSIHEDHGVVFHLGETIVSIDGGVVNLSKGGSLDAPLVIVGVGVQPVTAFIERAGIGVDDGVKVDAYLQTSAPGVFAAGDIARWPDPHSGERIRVEHWVLAERQGQAAARNILGHREAFEAAPFFWSQHYDVTINYVGHAPSWDAIEQDGDLGRHDCTMTYRRGNRTLAVATIGRDRENLAREVELEHATASLAAR
jgi:NADPH-dependent 2,4-dienoyl-CoA reductase/sulfur reductase-like enzyme/nitrite reductase/ring-hydroxylating ferredoxin subunit